MCRVAALVLAVLCAIGCAGPRFERTALDDWHAVEVAGARMIADATAEELRGLARDLAGFDAAFAFLVGRQITATTPTTIVLIRNPELAGRFGLGDGVLGVASATFHGSYARVLLQDCPMVCTRQILFHEYTHLLLWRHRNARIPRWYTEGLAEYFSTVAFRDGGLVVGSAPTHRLAWFVQRRKRHPMPLDLLFGGEPESTLRGVAIDDFYATAWALTHYLLGSPKGRRELSRFDKELALGIPLDAAREAAFARSFANLDQEVAAHVGYLARGVAAETALDPKKIAIAEPPPAVPLRRGDVADVLGSLALTLAGEPEDEDEGGGHYAALSRALLDIAVDEDPTSARTRAALARARALTGDRDGAARVLGDALRDAPEDAQVQVDAGRVALAAGDTEEAEARFRRSLSLDERSPTAWFELGRMLARADRADAALEALERARTLAWSDAIDLELGRLHVAARRADEARALLQPLAADPHGGAIAEKATALLEELDAPRKQ